MIEIIKSGKEKFAMTCPKCGCEFTYQIEDLSETDIVLCPECKTNCVHPKQDKPITINTPSTTPLPHNPWDGSQTPIYPYSPWNDVVHGNDSSYVDWLHKATQTYANITKINSEEK